MQAIQTMQVIGGYVEHVKKRKIKPKFMKAKRQDPLESDPWNTSGPFKTRRQTVYCISTNKWNI